LVSFRHSELTGEDLIYSKKLEKSIKKANEDRRKEIHIKNDVFTKRFDGQLISNNYDLFYWDKAEKK